VIPEKHGGAFSNNRRYIPSHAVKIEKASRDHLAIMFSPDMFSTKATVRTGVPTMKKTYLAGWYDDARRAHLKQ
jgi:hypothetical protein